MGVGWGWGGSRKIIDARGPADLILGRIRCGDPPVTTGCRKFSGKQRSPDGNRQRQ